MRAKSFVAALAMLAVLSMAACAPEPNVARHTVAEYRADAQLRRGLFARCVNDPGTLGQSPDCINAREAERLESRGSLRDQPPLGLGPAPPR